jgi:hypothetical protein
VAESLSACVIVRDEEERLPACLDSLAFCDELVVVDSGSRDRTREIARAAGARVIENPWPGFAIQRNVALEAASGDWALEIDADERVSPELASEIQRFLEQPPSEVQMVALPMRDLFLGAPLGRSSRYPRYRHRLFRRQAFRHDETRTVHEGLWPDGPTAVLEGELRHLLASSWREALADALAYARLEAAQRPAPGLRDAVFGTLVRPSAKFLYRFWLYGGWRDGGRGLARIGLECGADSLATLLRLRGRSGGDGTAGFGQEPPRQGPVRLVGLASSAAGERHLGPWLAEARQHGADAALIGPGTDPLDDVRRRRPEGKGLGALVRALDAEDQVRPIDALVPAGGRERVLLRLVPQALRGAVPPLVGLDPPAAINAVQRTTRPG